MWYYVRYEEKTGYLLPEFTTVPEITFDEFVPDVNEENNDEIIAKEDEEPEPGTDANFIDKIKNNDLVKILLISGLCLVLVVLIILIFIPSKHRKNRYYYEE